MDMADHETPLSNFLVTLDVLVDNLKYTAKQLQIDPCRQQQKNCNLEFIWKKKKEKRNGHVELNVCEHHK